MKVYFDNAATTIVRPEAVDAMVRVMRENYGNPSSMHEQGRTARAELEAARSTIAMSMGASPDSILFTSGGTEANNIAVLGTSGSFKHKGKHIITSAIEHSAILDPIKKLENEGFEVTYLMPDRAGVITGDAFSAALRNDTVFASVMFVNNETGVKNPVNDYVNEIKRRGLSTILHTDAVQGLCKIPFTVNSLGADLISVSSHKLHGPKGVGALYIKKGIKTSPLILGGSQEKGNRGGTEALPAAVGFSEAVSLGMLERDNNFAAVNSLREYVSRLLEYEVPEAVLLVGGNNICSPYILPISLPGYKSEVLMNFLDGESVFVSRSAACKKGARSRTLEAMDFTDEVIDGALRISFSRYNTKEEIEYFIQVLKNATAKLIRT